MIADSFLTEESFFHEIVPLILDAVKKTSKFDVALKHEEGVVDLNYVTAIDEQVEAILVKEIRKRFPNDAILSEENYAKQGIPVKGRLWILDPICATVNMARGIDVFSTNIALTKEGKVIAGCVVDHTRKEYIWSIGNGRIYINKKLLEAEKKRPGTLVDVDFGAMRICEAMEKRQYGLFITRLLAETDYQLMSFNASLTFAYVALGRVDAYVSLTSHIWDLPAINFLIEQAGGIVTDNKGNPWTLSKKSAIAALDKKLHAKLLSLFNS